MRRRDFITVVGVVAVWPVAAYAQQDDRVRALKIRILRLQAEGVAEKFGHFIKEIESQMGWTTQLTWSSATIEQRRFDGLRLLKQVPAITDLAQLDPTGKERLRVSRLVMDLGPSENDEKDYSHDPKFADAVAKKAYYGPVYLRRQSAPYMTLSVAGTRLDAGVSVAEVSLKLVWDIVRQMKLGDHGVTYVLDAHERVIAHSNMFLGIENVGGRVVEHIDFSLFQRDFSSLTQVQEARAAGAVQVARDINGREVVAAYAPVPPLGWLVFLELPVEEANSIAQ